MSRTPSSGQGHARGYREIITGPSWFESAMFVFGDDNRLKAISASVASEDAAYQFVKSATEVYGQSIPFDSGQHGAGVKWLLSSGVALVCQNKGICGLYSPGFFDVF